VAPHMSFLEERAISLDEAQDQNEVNTYLIFGNRNKDKDYIHQEVMEKWNKEEK